MVASLRPPGAPSRTPFDRHRCHTAAARTAGKITVERARLVITLGDLLRGDRGDMGPSINVIFCLCRIHQETPIQHVPLMAGICTRDCHPLDERIAGRYL
jgi:hypothetical protein